MVGRGYGGQARVRVNVVSDGQRIILDAAMAGGPPIVCWPNPCRRRLWSPGFGRHWPTRYAIAKLGAQVIVFGRWLSGSARDLDLVLFKGLEFLGNGRIFPGGDLRESFSALGRASAFVLTDTVAPLSPTGAAFPRSAGREPPGAAHLFGQLSFRTLTPANNLAGGAGGPCLAFCRTGEA